MLNRLIRTIAMMVALCGLLPGVFGPLRVTVFAEDGSLPSRAGETTGDRPRDGESPITTAGVAELIRQLGSDTRREREQAEVELIELGTEILAHLPSPTVADVPAIRDAVARIRNTLERRAALSASEASRITLKGTFTLVELCEAIRQQTGNAFTAASEGKDVPIALDWTGRALWEAVGDLEQRGIQVEFERQRSVMSCSGEEGPPARRMVSSNGPFRIEVLRVTTKPNFIRPQERVLQVRWRLNLEPRLRPLYAMIEDRDITVTENGDTYAPLSLDAKRELPVDRWTGCEVDSSFQIPEGAPLSELQFSAAGTLKLAALPLPITFRDLDRRKTGIQRRGGVTAILRLVEQEKPSGLLRLKVVVNYDRGGPEFESHRLWIHQNAAWLLLDEAGTTLDPVRADLDSTAPQGGTLTYEFENVPESLAGASFVYEAPSLVTDATFRVEGIPLVIESEAQARE